MVMLMNKRSITSIAGGSLDCEVIRFFEKDQNTYLIYSLNEIDEVGYVKLYASKINDNRANIIADDEEWSFVKEIIKDIVRNNRDGLRVDVKDLNENKLDRIVLEDTRVFKLQGNLVNLLMENKIVEPEIEPEDTFDFDTIVEPDLYDDTIELDSDETFESDFETEDFPIKSRIENEDLSVENEDLSFENEEYNDYQDNEPDYELLYNGLKDENELLENKIASLEQEIESYKEKLEAIENILRSE